MSAKAGVVVLPPLLLLLLLHPCPTEAAMGLIHHLPLIFVAIFLVFFRKAGWDIERFLKEFHHIDHHKKAMVSVVVMVAFVVVLLGLEMKEGAGPDLTPFLLQALAATLAVGLLDALRVHRSIAGDWEQVVQRSPNTVARGLAAAFHSYLTNVIYGVDGVSWSHEEALHDYLKSQHLRNDEFTWISDKVLLLFPDSARISDSVPDMLKREKDRRECLGLVNQTIRHHYEVAGKQRQSVLHVFKLRHGGPNGWRNNYFIFAENRPLVSLHQMVAAGLLTKEQLGEQFVLYKRELQRLLAADEGCRGKYEVVEYQGGGALSEVLRVQMLTIEDTWLTGKAY